MSETFLEKFIRTTLDGETFDPGLEAMTPKERKKLLPAGDEIESVLTNTINAIDRNPKVIIRNIDLAQTKHNIARLTFFEKMATVFMSVAKLLRDQELILENKLQRDANHINKEVKPYLENDSILAAEFKDLTDYMSRNQEGLKRNRALLDKAVNAAEQDAPKPDDASSKP